MARVVVIGAGYAGVMAANRLAAAGRSDVGVTVVNPRPDFVERVRLHEHAAGATHAVRPLSGLLHRDVRLRVATVETIAERSVRLDDGGALAFDHLLYAVGSTAAHDLPGPRTPGTSPTSTAPRRCARACVSCPGERASW